MTGGDTKIKEKALECAMLLRALFPDNSDVQFIIATMRCIKNVECAEQLIAFINREKKQDKSKELMKIEIGLEAHFINLRCIICISERWLVDPAGRCL